MDIDNAILAFCRNHKWQILCAVIGLLFALFVISYGFWKAIFICVCIAGGLYIGKKLDSKLNIKDAVEEIFKNNK